MCFWLLVNAYACICMSALGGQRLASVGVSYGTWEFTSLIRMIDQRLSKICPSLSPSSQNWVRGLMTHMWVPVLSWQSLY